MDEIPRVAVPPSKPVMIFDGDCRFCRAWIERWQQTTRESVEYVPFQDPSINERFPEIPRERYGQAVHLIEPSGGVFVGAAAVFRSLAAAGSPGTLWIYENVLGFPVIAEFCYRVVARHRSAAWFVTRLLWGDHVLRPSYKLTRWVFLRLVGVIYLIAFLSLWSQIDGLVGSNGIVPEARWIEAIRAEPDASFFEYPTLVWFNTCDGFLHFLCVGGIVCSVLLIVGIAPAPALVILWVFYLSLSIAGQVFLRFQWDALLLETGFLAIFFAPWRPWPRLAEESAPSRTVLWLLRWLLFRLVFQSGMVKLMSPPSENGHQTWRELTALTYHYETQPLPTWIGWYAHQLPAWFQRWSVLGMFFIELVVPFLIFLPRRARQAAFAALLTLQLLIAMTGNYCFFNLLAIALCTLLLDDGSLGRFLPRSLVARIHKCALPRREPLAKTICVVGLAAIVLLVSSCQLGLMFTKRRGVPAPIRAVLIRSMPFDSINSYGLFAVMTTSRPEIVIEGSNDRVTWLAYEFKYKPGDPNRRPAFVAPHQPRLDWQMWFAALDDYRRNPWLLNFMVRLLQGSPQVLPLLETNPFPDEPPRYVRALLYDYYFTDRATRRATGAWWRRELVGLYCPVLTSQPSERSDSRQGPGFLKQPSF